MNIGDYVRTKDGIARYKEDFPNIYNKIRHYADGNCIRGCYCFDDEDIIKTSPNIIDLIEVGDYVNGLLVLKTEIDSYGKSLICGYNYYMDVNGATCYYNEDIKSVVTHEQFSSMEYRLGDK